MDGTRRQPTEEEIAALTKQIEQMANTLGRVLSRAHLDFLLIATAPGVSAFAAGAENEARGEWLTHKAKQIVATLEGKYPGAKNIEDLPAHRELTELGGPSAKNFLQEPPVSRDDGSAKRVP